MRYKTITHSPYITQSSFHIPSGATKNEIQRRWISKQPSFYGLRSPIYQYRKIRVLTEQPFLLSGVQFQPSLRLMGTPPAPGTHSGSQGTSLVWVLWVFIYQYLSSSRQALPLCVNHSIYIHIHTYIYIYVCVFERQKDRLEKQTKRENSHLLFHSPNAYNVTVKAVPEPEPRARDSIPHGRQESNCWSYYPASQDLD